MVAFAAENGFTEIPMKTLLAATLIFGCSFATLIADIQDPPANEYGPTRKLGRGLSNVAFGIAELPVQIARVNATEGNAAALSYGVVRGIGRSYWRLHTAPLGDAQLSVSAKPRHLLPHSAEPSSPHSRWLRRVPARAGERIEISVRPQILTFLFLFLFVSMSH
jgi:putative exosortase-associated protein (TIGR04073 family)